MVRSKALSAALSLLLTAGLMACGSGDVHVRTKGELVEISLTPANQTVASNSSQQYIATGIYSDNTTEDLTASVTWEISDTNVAVLSDPVSSKGRITFIAPGSTTVRAIQGSRYGSTIVTVTTATLISITITPNNPSMALGTSRQLTATGTYSDNSTQDLTASVTWSSTNTSVAAISNAAGSQGLVTGISAGTTQITALSGGASGAAMLTVAAAGTGAATLMWGAPTTYTDGSPLTNLGGYRIYYGTAAGTYTMVIDVGNVTTYVINNLTPGATYYFAVTTYDSSALESDYSNEISKMIM